MNKKIIKIICFLFHSFFASYQSQAQRDIIFKKDTTQIRCKILKASANKYQYAYADSASRVFKTTILKALVDSIKQNFYDSNLVQNKLFGKIIKPITEEITPIQKKWIFTAALGFNIGNLLEYNSPSGTDKKSLSGTASIDLGLNYSKDGARFAMTNELHYIFGLQKSGLTGADHIQRVTDELATLHDLSVAIGKTKKWNFNLIAKTSTSIFTIYDGDYFKDINVLGKIQGFLSPYDITISPGIKWQHDNYLRISISPYSFNMYGVKQDEILNKGIFISETNISGNFKKHLFKRLGAEINFWYDRKIKSWIDMQYRLGISSNYFEKIAKNGLLDGLFITKFKLLRNLYLTHRASLRGDFSINPFKPYYSQSILLSYSKTF